MDILSIIYIILLVVFAIIGLCKGFVKAIISFIKGLVATIASIFLCKPISNWLNTTKIAKESKSKLSEYFINKGGNFTSEFSTASLTSWAESKNLPNFVINIINKIATKLNVEGANETLANVLSKTIVYYGSLIISYLACFLLILLIISILLKIFKKIEEKSSFIKFTNRLLGCGLYIFFGLFIIGLFNYVVTFIISKDGSAASWFIETMKLNQDSFTLSKFFYEHNFVGFIISLIQRLLIK